MEIAAALLVALGVLALVIFVRPADLPPPEPVSPTVHLDQRKAQIYEGLRDLQFEYRLGKLSDADYQTAKGGLQRDLAVVLADIDRVLGAVPPTPVKQVKAPGFRCTHCGAAFSNPMKFCGSCGKPMEAQA
jgi:hypothetical protein